MRLFRTVSKKIIAQDAMLKTQRGVSGTINLKAPQATVKQRARTPNGPIKERAMSGKKKVAGFPKRPKKVFVQPLKRSMAKTPKKGTKTPVKRIPKAPSPKCPLLILPTTRGNTRFPEPKNIENIARPVDNIKLLFFIWVRL